MRVPYGVRCATHGLVVFSEQEYRRQLESVDDVWRCPTCMKEGEFVEGLDVTDKPNFEVGLMSPLVMQFDFPPMPSPRFSDYGQQYIPRTPPPPKVAVAKPQKLGVVQHAVAVRKLNEGNIFVGTLGEAVRYAEWSKEFYKSNDTKSVLAAAVRLDAPHAAAEAIARWIRGLGDE